jgi:hypothetical protein
LNRAEQDVRAAQDDLEQWTAAKDEIGDDDHHHRLLQERVRDRQEELETLREQSASHDN